MLHRNWALKLAAFALAVFLWFWVTLHVRSAGQDGDLAVRSSRITTFSVRTIPVVPRTRGELAPGYAVLSVQLDPPIVTVVGTPARVRPAREILTEPVDLTGADRSFTREVKLATPAGLETPNVSAVRMEVSIGRAPAPRTP